MKKAIALRTLVIDDDEHVCRVLRNWLAEAAHDVAAFTNARLAAESAATGAYQLALVDLRLPDATGVDVIEDLLRVSPETRVVAMSAFPDTPQVVEAVRAGARDVLSKPIERPALMRAVDRQLTGIGITGVTEAEFNRRLGRRLRVLRMERRLTLKNVAGVSGITAAQLSQIELGKNATTTWTLARICGALRQPLAKVCEEL